MTFKTWITSLRRAIFQKLLDIKFLLKGVQKSSIVTDHSSSCDSESMSSHPIDTSLTFQQFSAMSSQDSITSVSTTSLTTSSPSPSFSYIIFESTSTSTSGPSSASSSILARPIQHQRSHSVSSMTEHEKSTIWDRAKDHTGRPVQRLWERVKSSGRPLCISSRAATTTGVIRENVPMRVHHYEELGRGRSSSES